MASPRGAVFVSTWPFGRSANETALESDPVGNTFGGLGSGMEDVRRLAADFLGADLTEVALTRNTTEGMNGVATRHRLEAGDEVLTTNHEHGGGMVCWQPERLSY